MNQQQNGNMQDTVLVNGYVTKDIEVKEITTKDGIKLPVANFSIVYENINQEKEYRSISAYGDNVEKVADFKKGDFVHIQGTEQHYTSKTGKEYTSIRMSHGELLEANQKRQELVSLKGNLTKDVEVGEITTKDGEKLPVANFSIAYTNENNETEYRSISAYGDNVEKVADLKKGDFVHIQGTEKRYTSKTGREYVSVNMKACHVLKSKEDRTRNKQHKGKDAPELTKVANKKQEEREM